ncbi:hypothetical protein cyc_01068 [Cyclospora cayetanensis]|uniref:Uncharacterized protein n=1 Tax=Cyclospora cayetanensis TaxID=88456 RepID=A0A1D3D397_9EIME|nr:hypothetical protein cyc_01068 [Cyclospora cayetanensis]
MVKSRPPAPPPTTSLPSGSPTNIAVAETVQLIVISSVLCLAIALGICFAFVLFFYGSATRFLRRLVTGKGHCKCRSGRFASLSEALLPKH